MNLPRRTHAELEGMTLREVQSAIAVALAEIRRLEIPVTLTRHTRAELEKMTRDEQRKALIAALVEAHAEIDRLTAALAEKNRKN